MLPEFEYMRLIFENCNSVKIPFELIKYSYFNNVHEYIFTNYSRQYIRHYVCDEFEIELELDALNILTKMDEHLNDGIERDSFEKHLKDYVDLSGVSIKPNDEDEFEVGVPWSERSEYRNYYQSVEFVDDAIVISVKRG